LEESVGFAAVERAGDIELGVSDVDFYGHARPGGDK
jgi:hypothetical protein